MSFKVHGKLVCLNGPSSGQEVVLGEGTSIVGRAPNCDIVLDDKFASRQHAMIDRLDGQYLVRDIGSKNGISVNQYRLSRDESVVLTDGAVVTFANTRFRFEDPAATMTNLSLEKSETASVLRLHEASRHVLINGVPLNPPLSLKQFDLLCLLHDRLGQAVSKHEIANAVWPEETDGVADSNVDRLVSRVRSRLADATGGNQFIETVRGFGFRMLDPDGNGK
ncbi:MAG: FHA domain-containing protein [Caldilineaceae bacterium]|nr:FHA domain-containing protein [Caldilineaceae bacterium]